MASTTTLNSRGKSKQPRVRTSSDVEIQDIEKQGTDEHASYYKKSRLIKYIKTIEDNYNWNWFISVTVMCCIMQVFGDPIMDDIFIKSFDVFYLIFCLCIAMNIYGSSQQIDLIKTLRTMVDAASFLVYVFDRKTYPNVAIACYYARLHRPIAYIWALNEYNLELTVFGTAWKYMYIFTIFRITFAFIWDRIQMLSPEKNVNRNYSRSILPTFYIVDKMFTPIGPTVPITTDIERITCMSMMVTGCLVVTGAAIASLSLVISIYLRPEEAFRARYRLIIKEMRESRVPLELQEKVQTFYKMYWSKQNAVSTTHLLPTFPPSLPASVFTDIYFEATQRSRVLKELRYQFLWELSKHMITVNYIPGDSIIKRNDNKISVIYITYGDIDMLTAEDDVTPILRLTRGTVLTPCGVVPIVGGGRAHVEIRAASFCTAHVINATDLWRTVLKYGRNGEELNTIHYAFTLHIEKVKRHYFFKPSEPVKHKSSIKHFKQHLLNLMTRCDENGRRLLPRTVFLEAAECYVMRNCIESSMVDESDAICLRPTFPCILQPESSLLVLWNLFIAGITLAVCITHPYYLVFKKSVPLSFRVYDYIVTVIYVVDLIVVLSTGVNVEQGMAISFAQTSWQQMRTYWFILDMLGTLPIFEILTEGHFAGINKLLRIPRVFRVLKGIEDTCVYHSNVIRFFSYTLMMLIACYLIAAWQQGFMCFKYDRCVVTNFTHVPFWEKKPLDDETTVDRLYFSLYWAISIITFTTHNETFAKQSEGQVLLMLMVIEVSILLHIFIEGLYSATIMVTTALSEDYDSCIANVKNFLNRNKLDPVLQERFITYLQLCWYTDKAYSMSLSNKKSSIFFDLPPHVYQDIVAKQRSKYILSIPFMRFLRKEDLKTISSGAILFYTSPNEIILSTGDICNEIYVIKQGICEVLDPESKEVVSNLSVKSNFGVLECMLRIPAYYTVRAVTHVQILSISRKFFASITKEIPQVKDAVQFAKEQPEYSRLMEFREPILMYQRPERTPNRMMFELPRKHEQDTAFLQPFGQMGFLSIMRYIYPRFTIRPDGKYLMRYEWFRLTCALLSSLVFPLSSYLVLQYPYLYHVTLLLDLSAYFDIFQRMLIGYFLENGVLVYHPLSTSGHYLRGPFLIDLVACLPLESLDTVRKEIFGSTNILGKANMYRVREARQFLMLNRQLQLYRLPGAMANCSEYLRKDIKLILHAIPLFMAVINVSTCFIVFSSVQIFYIMDTSEWFILPIEKEGGSWINIFSNAFRFNVTESPWNMFLGSYFWVTYQTTTTGYNNIRPSGRTIMLVLFVGQIVSAMLITVYSVRIISIRANVNKPLVTYQEHLKDMIAFMKRENLSDRLQREVILYYAYNWKKKCGVDSRNVLKLCDQITLRTDIILNLYGSTFAKCLILADLDVSLIRLVGRGVRSIFFLKQMRIFDIDDVISDIFIVDSGVIQIQEQNKSFCVSIKLNRGSVFGNIECEKYARSKKTIVAFTDVRLLQINAVRFLNIISEFPDICQRFHTLRQENDSYIKPQNFSDLDLKFETDLQVFRFSLIHFGRKSLVAFLNPQNLHIQVYRMVVCMSCILADLYNAGFQDNRPGLILFLYIFDLLFFAKVLVKFLLPHITTDPDMARILYYKRNIYLHSYFKYDVISCLPIELLSFLSSEDQLMVFSLLRLNRLFRIRNMQNTLRTYHEKIRINLALITIISVLTWFSIFVHASTCIWHFIGILEDRIEPESSWMYKDKPSGNLSSSNQTAESWCDNMYICSLYFILTTFTQNGVGDIMPKKKSEVIFVSILQIISVMICMIYVGEFSNIIQYQTFRAFSYHFKCLELRKFMKNNRVSKTLVKLVNEYSLHLWRESRGQQMPYFLKEAPHCIKLKVMAEAYMSHFSKIPVFKDCEPAFLRHLVIYLNLYTYNKGMFVVKENEITDSMYVVHRGKVCAVDENEKPTKIYGDGACFGMLQGLFRNLRFLKSYQTTVNSQVLTLHLQDWEYLLNLFPKSRDEINKHVQNDGSDPRGGSNMPGFFGPKRPQPTSKLRSHTSTFPHGPPGSSGFSGPTNIPQASPTSATPGPSTPTGLLESHDPTVSSLKPQDDPSPNKYYQPDTSESLPPLLQNVQPDNNLAIDMPKSSTDIKSSTSKKSALSRESILHDKSDDETNKTTENEKEGFLADAVNSLQSAIIKMREKFSTTSAELLGFQNQVSNQIKETAAQPVDNASKIAAAASEAVDDKIIVPREGRKIDEMKPTTSAYNADNMNINEVPQVQSIGLRESSQKTANVHFNKSDTAYEVQPSDLKNLTLEQKKFQAMDSDTNPNQENQIPDEVGPSEEQTSKQPPKSHETENKPDRNSRKNK